MFYNIENKLGEKVMFNLMAGETNNSVFTWIIMGVLLLAIIGLFVWQSISGKKKQKEAQDMINSLKIGDRIKTIGGVCGFLVEINNAENTIVIETGSENNKCHIKFDKGAIYQTGPANPAKPEEKAEIKVEEKAEEKVEAPADTEAAAEEVKPAPAKKTVRKSKKQ